MAERKMKDSGIKWIGQIPENWCVHPIYAFFNERKNKNFDLREKNLLSLSYGKIIRKNIDSVGGLLPSSFNTYNIVEVNDIIIRPTDLQNDKRSLRTGLVTEKGIITSAYIALAPKEEVNSSYFHYLMHSYDVQKVFYNMGNGVRQGLNYTEFAKLMVFAPPSHEQESIVSFLDAKCAEIDALTTDIQSEIDTLEKYKKSIITEAVTKGLDKNVKMKDSGIEWIGEIPEDWEISKLKYVLTVPMKYGASESGIDYDANLPRYIRITDITIDSKLKDTGKLSLTETQAKEYILEDNTILFARSGATVGKTFLYKSVYGRSAFAGYLIAAKCNQAKALPEWIYYYTQSFSYNEWTNMVFSQATIQNIGADKYSNMEIILAPMDEQMQIVTYLDMKCAEINRAISDKKNQLKTLEAYKKSIIYEYVTGKKEVPANE